MITEEHRKLARELLKSVVGKWMPVDEERFVEAIERVEAHGRASLPTSFQDALSDLFTARVLDPEHQVECHAEGVPALFLRLHAAADRVIVERSQLVLEFLEPWDGWYRCEAGNMPPEGRRVQFRAAKWGQQTCAYGVFARETRRWLDQSDRDEGGAYSVYSESEISHWRELPEPPKEKP